MPLWIEYKKQPWRIFKTQNKNTDIYIWA